jgi:hypothetical protein
MNMEVDAEWDENGNNIRVKTQVEPCMLPDEGETFAIGYVMTASGLSDTAVKMVLFILFFSLNNY